jgi:PST family polysaccharide transporter
MARAEGTSGTGGTPEPGGPAPARRDDSSSLVRATFVTGGSRIVSQLLRLVSSLVLARLLTPEDFGAIAVAMVIVVFLDQLRDLGTGSAVIQRAERTEAMVNSVFSLNMVMTTVMALVLAAAAGPITSLLGQPGTANILRLYAVVSLVAAAGQVHYALLQRDLRFVPTAAVMVLESLVTAVVSIGLAIPGFGPWAIAGGTLAGTVASTTAVWIASGWRPSGLGTMTELREVWRFSTNIFLANIVWFVAVGQADKAIISRVLGLSPLGVYSFGQRTVTYPLVSVKNAVGQVIYPALSRNQGDPAAMRRILLRATGAVGLVLLPAMSGLAVVSAVLMPLLVGDGWGQLPLLVAILAPTTAIQSVLSLSNHVTTAAGRPQLTFHWQAAQAVAFVASFLIGVQWGIVGVSIGYAVCAAGLAPIGVVIAGRLIQLTTREYLAALYPALASTALVVAVAWPLVSFAGHGWVAVATAVTAAVVAELALLAWWRPQPVRDVLGALRRSKLAT